MPTASQIATWEALAEVMQPSPRFDEDGQLVPLGKPEADVSYYVVWSGRAVGIFMNWGLANAMTCGYTGAAHKKYKTLEDARLAWAQGPTGPIEEYHPPPEPTLRPSTPPPPSQDDSSSDESISMPGTHVQTPVAEGGQAGMARATIPASLPLSPTSSISSISYLSGLSISSGTATPRTVHTTRSTPTGPTPSSKTPVSPSPSKAPSPIISRTTSCGPGRRREPQPIRIAALSRTPTSERKRPIPTASSTGGGSAQVGQADALLTTTASPTKGKVRSPSPPIASSSRHVEGQPQFSPQRVEVHDGQDVYVVVRGDQPGVYLDRNTAMLMVGTSPGMKIVRFRSRKKAAWYFVQEYMAGRVGIPVVVVNDD
ncbi:hypothetical protein FKP32DRAFT_1671250 [Trametes sanguinea]|nr:hypothetical protein FKP32DRAFT_1671250 [Trametes sanguinea]